ncbi:hypothetical protein EVAR_47077_1 [Eumeta japonica]|uniref:Uncharacterized protein n=1 Tax=Eumeta variegata TaxID=151549 RepID=A0A4C1WM30_EUMVA|nr:hypothetical protein EVAR_47077_1 [Eumeta japonica]
MIPIKHITAAISCGKKVIAVDGQSFCLTRCRVHPQGAHGIAGGKQRKHKVMKRFALKHDTCRHERLRLITHTVRSFSSHLASAFPSLSPKHARRKSRPSLIEWSMRRCALFGLAGARPRDSIEELAALRPRLDDLCEQLANITNKTCIERQNLSTVFRQLKWSWNLRRRRASTGKHGACAKAHPKLVRRPGESSLDETQRTEMYRNCEAPEEARASNKSSVHM